MSDEHNAEWYEKKFKPMIYLVAGILLAGTAITYVADILGIAEKWGFRNAIIFALGVAAVKASTVIYIFMHLKWDINLKTISLTMACAVIFLIGMMWLTVGMELKDEDGVAGKPGGTETTWKHGEPSKVNALRRDDS